MVNATKDDATHSIDDHARTIDALHEKLAATPGVDRERLNRAVEKLKTAHKTFRDDALECMN